MGSPAAGACSSYGLVVHRREIRRTAARVLTIWIAIAVGVSLAPAAEGAGGYKPDPVGDATLGVPWPAAIPPKAHLPGFDLTGVHLKNGRNVAVMTAYVRKPKVRSNVVFSFAVDAKAWGQSAYASVRVMRRRDGTKAGPRLDVWGPSWDGYKACRGIRAQWFPGGSRRVVVTVPQGCWRILGPNGRKRVRVGSLTTWNDMHGIDFATTKWVHWR